MTPSGNIVAGGFYYDTVDFDPASVHNVHFTAVAEQNDAYVVELAPNGTLVWAKTFEGGAFAAGVATDGAGAVYASGSTAGSGAVDFDPGPGTYFLSATQASGY